MSDPFADLFGDPCPECGCTDTVNGWCRGCGAPVDTEAE